MNRFGSTIYDIGTLITSISTLVLVLINGIISIRNAFKITRVQDTADHNAGKVEEIHLATNSMKDALVAASFAAGEKSQMDRQVEANKHSSE